MTEPRPTTLTPEMTLIAAQKIAEELDRLDLLDGFDTTEGAARDIAAVARRHMDGYEIARDLDQCKGWSPNVEIVETLDGFSVEAGRLILQAQREWVERCDIQPPHAVGTRVRVSWLRDPVEGVIKEVYEHGAAQYTITPDGWTKGQGRPIVYFESVEVIE